MCLFVRVFPKDVVSVHCETARGVRILKVGAGVMCLRMRAQNACVSLRLVCRCCADVNEL